MITDCNFCKRKVRGVKGKFSIGAFLLIPIIFGSVFLLMGNLFIFFSVALIYPLYHGLMKPRIYCPICGISLFRKDKK